MGRRPDGAQSGDVAEADDLPPARSVATGDRRGMAVADGLDQGRARARRGAVMADLMKDEAPALADAIEPERSKDDRADRATHVPNAPTEAPNALPSVQARAYELFLERGGQHGDDLSDWLRAERELAGTSLEAEQLTQELHQPRGN